MICTSVRNNLFIIPNICGEGYKIRDENGHVYEQTYNSIKAANDWILYINDLLSSLRSDQITYIEC